MVPYCNGRNIFCLVFVVKRNKEKALLKFLPLLFALQIIINTYCDTAGLSWSWKINFVTAAMPWFLSGYYFNTEGADKFKNMPLYRSASVAFIGCIIAVVPNAFDLPVNFGVVGFIPYTFGNVLHWHLKTQQQACHALLST